MSVSPTLYYAGQSTQEAMCRIPWVMQFMYYLSAFNTGLLKSYYSYALLLQCFVIQKNFSNIMKNVFNSISIYS